MKTAAAIAEIMKREGIDVLFGYPRNQLLEAAAMADIRTVIVRQERIGLHMADAVSRMTRGKKMGAFCMQHGPGAENAYGGVAQAYGDSVPVLVLPAGYPRRLAHVPYNFNSTLQMAGVSKHAEPVTIGAEVPNIFRRASRSCATAGRSRSWSKFRTTLSTTKSPSRSTTPPSYAPAPDRTRRMWSKSRPCS